MNYNKEYVLPLPEDSVVAEFLGEWRRKAIEASKWDGMPGRSSEIARLRLIKTLHGIYLMAGGKGRRCYPDSSADEGYKGVFYVFVQILVDYTSEKISPSQLGQFIINSIGCG